MTSINNFYEFEDYFSIISYLKVSGHSEKPILDSIMKFFKQIDTHNLGFKSQLIGPFFVFGQYDIMFIFNCPDLARGNRFFYAIIDYLNDNYPAGLKEFYRSIGFKWIVDFNFNKYSTCLAYANLKYSYPRKVNRPLISSLFINNIKEIISREELNLAFKAFGSFAWHEITLLFYGNNYDDLFCLSRNLPDIEYLSGGSFITLYDIQNPRPHISPDSQVITQLYGKFAFSSQSIYNFFTQKEIPTPDILSSLNHALVSFKSESIDDFVSFLSYIKSAPNVDYAKTILYKKEHNLCENLIDAEVSYDLKQPYQKDVKPIIDYFTNIEAKSLTKRKLLSLKTQLTILTMNKDFKYIFPENIIKSIDFLLDENNHNLSDETIQYYVSEYAAAIRERLGGAQHDAAIGQNVGFLDKTAPSQRLLLSCESLIMRCYTLYLENVLKVSTSYARRPVIFIFFDYGARLSTQMPSEVVALGIRENMPLILRLKMLKFQPWLWVTALRELSRALYFIVSGTTALDLFDEDPKIVSFSDNFLSHFLTLDNFKNLLKEELGFFRRVGHGEYDVYLHVEEEVQKRLEMIDIRESFLRDDYIDEGKISDYRRLLLKGELIFKLNDNQFINYINAYYSLNRSDQRKARPFVSFTLSLYWNHQSLKEV